jgi:hypothetical protein
MSTYKAFKSYNDELKTLSKVVNKFDFDELAVFLLENKAIGRFELFDDLLSRSKRYAFISFAIQHIYVYGSKQNPDKYSDLRLSHLVRVLFSLPDNDEQIKIYDATTKTRVIGTQIGFKNLLKLWNKATAAKTKKTQVVTK